MPTLSSYLLSAIVAWVHVPNACPGDLSSTCLPPDDAHWSALHFKEPLSDAVVRYSGIATDIANSGAMPGEALLLLALAFEESRFAPFVDDFECNHWKGWKTCDSGKAWSIFQLQMIVGESPPESREEAAIEALRRLRTWPQGWTTYKKAHALAERWVRKHPMGSM